MTPTAHEAVFFTAAGFRDPVAITQALHAALEPGEAEQALGQSYAGRLWDTLWLAWVSARRTKGDRFTFQILLAEAFLDAPDGLLPPEVILVALRGNAVHCFGDQGEPVITIGLPDDF